MTPDSGIMSVAEYDDAGAGTFGEGQAAGERGGGAPHPKHREQPAGRNQRVHEADGTREQAAIEVIVGERQRMAGETMAAKACVDEIRALCGPIERMLLQPSGHFLAKAAPRGDVFEEHIAVRDPYAIVVERKLGLRRDVGIMVAAEKRDAGRVLGKKAACLGDKRSGGVVLGIERIAVQDDLIRAREQRCERLQTVQGALPVAVMQVGKDA